MSEARMFYVLSLKYSNGTYWVWWGPNNGGYAQNLDAAGRYTEEQIRKHPGYYNDGRETRAIPCDVVDALKANRVVVMREEDRRAMLRASLEALGSTTDRVTETKGAGADSTRTE